MSCMQTNLCSPSICNCKVCSFSGWSIHELQNIIWRWPPFFFPSNFYQFVCSFDEPFEEVVYPKGDPDAVSISKRDVDLLQPETFVNDTIIDFYIQWVKLYSDCFEFCYFQRCPPVYFPSVGIFSFSFKVLIHRTTILLFANFTITLHE